ncbi:MAG: TetR family transcriptional regulator [Clostridiales bacterium]|nr:TetR family transcriptional regulator [Candidatus Cacconaster stercorequi]
MGNQHDLRVQRTELFIKNAFLHLLDEQPFEKIQVNDIAQRAMINRSTFYLHYRDKYDLLEQLKAQMIRDIGGFTDSLTREMVLVCRQEHTPLPHLLALLAYVETLPAFFRLVADNDPSFYRRIGQPAQQKIAELFPELQNDALPPAYGEAILTSLLRCVIEQWISRDLKEPKEDVALLLTQIILADKLALYQLSSAAPQA